MDSELLRAVQLTQLDMAKELKKICEKHHITYFIDCGSLLGAVRHQGFIPWDDDMDFGMMREDYNRFLEIAPKELPANLFLQTADTDPGYGYAFAKIRKRDSLYLERVSQNSKENHGVFIDIFPYDSLPDTTTECKKLYQKLTALKMMLKVKAKYEPWNDTEHKNWKRWILYRPAYFLSLFFSKETLLHKYNKTACQYNSCDTEKCFPQVAETFGQWEMNRSIFSEMTDLAFEDTTFPAPIGYKELLSVAYGDYMSLPAEDQRTSTHGVLRIQVGQPLN